MGHLWLLVWLPYINYPLIQVYQQYRSTMDIENSPQTLPILSHKAQILSLITRHPTTIICGQTGSGKTTQVPQYLYPHYPNILITQPRRISAITLAERVCSEMGVQIGEEVGYSVRFQERRTLGKTRITFMTDGMAIREIMAGREFDAYVVDQAHQRSINTDVLMALLRDKMKYNNKYHNETKGKGRMPKRFKIIVMSATIEASKFMDFFETQSIVRIKGRTYPTQIYNVLQPVENYLQAAYNTAMQIHTTQPPGDILIFLTGQDQILSLHKRLTKACQTLNIPSLLPLMLYSALPHDQQHQIFTPAPQNKRKVILATNIAQTSITINGLRYVVDCGFMKIRVYDSGKGIDMLTVVPVSKANAVQRAGRAGREAQGKCYRLYGRGDFEELKEQTVPEILRSELTGPILQLKAIGISKISQLQFMDNPPPQTLTSCLTLLKQLNCLTESQTITPYGLEVSKIPLPPFLSSLLIQSHEHKCSHIMLNVLSVLSIDNLFYVGKESGDGEGREGREKNACVLEVMKKYMNVLGGNYLFSDHLAKGNILQEYIKSSNKKNFCKGNYINKNNIKRAVLIRNQLEDYLQQIITQRSKKQFHSLTSPKTKPVPLSEKHKATNEQIMSWLKCMEKGSINNVAKLNKDGTYTIVSSGQCASIHPESLLFFVKAKPSLVVFHQVIRTTRLYLRDVTGLPN